MGSKGHSGVTGDRTRTPILDQFLDVGETQKLHVVMKNLVYICLTTRTNCFTSNLDPESGSGSGSGSGSLST